VSNPFAESDSQQASQTFKTPVEIQANLRVLQEGRDPLVIRFEGRDETFRSFLIAIDKDNGVYALDELMPNDGERFIADGVPFNAHGLHDGVKISWNYSHALRIGELNGAKCYWGYLPEAVVYHQRRNAFRVPLKITELVKVELGGKQLNGVLSGKMLDISATGCRICIAGNATSQVQSGLLYETFTARLPFGALTMAIEMRHCHYSESADMTFAGVRFHRVGGLEQRQVERFVSQLQREAKRMNSDLF
jgi:c-di-GMP-binding flagellar brake protein YcgR